MKEEILDIAKKLYHNHLTPEASTNLLLALFESQYLDSKDKSSENAKKELRISDVRSMLIEFGNWLYEDDWREMDDGHTERVVDRFLNSINYF